eukprot:scaffold6190_cov146-Isochrysis_galbana.AAC.2
MSPIANMRPCSSYIFDVSPHGDLSLGKDLTKGGQCQEPHRVCGRGWTAVRRVCAIHGGAYVVPVYPTPRLGMCITLCFRPVIEL